MAETYIQYTVSAPVIANLLFPFEPAVSGGTAVIDVESSFFGDYTDYQLTSRDNITKSFKGTVTADVKVSVKSGELKLVHYGDVITLVIGDGVTVLSKLLNTADNRITMLTSTPPTLLDTTGGENLTEIIVPKGAGAAYKAAWADYAAIIKEEKTMKTVTSGAHYTTVTVDTAEAVKFSFPSTSLSVEAAGGDITVALTDTAQAGDDETITVPDGESRMFIHHRMNVDTYYLTGSGTAKLYASNMGDVNPFKAGKRGGDSGGDNTHYKGTTTTPLENGSTTNPIVIDGESYTAVFGDVVVYGYTEFVFDGTTWSEFGRPFDTTPTQGSTNAVTSDGINRAILGKPGGGNGHSVKFGNWDNSYATGWAAFSAGNGCTATGDYSVALNSFTRSNQTAMTAIGSFNSPRAGDLFNIGNGSGNNNRSNIVEVNRTSMNVNGNIKVNNIAIPTPYTTMPTITESMLGQIAMYVGTTGNGYTQGCFYIATTDGAVEPTYSWVRIGGVVSSDLGALAYKDTASGTAVTTVGTLPSLTYDSVTESFTFSAGTLPTTGTVTVS